jgi:hypothetical protein
MGFWNGRMTGVFGLKNGLFFGDNFAKTINFHRYQSSIILRDDWVAGSENFVLYSKIEQL